MTLSRCVWWRWSSLLRTSSGRLHFSRFKGQHTKLRLTAGLTRHSSGNAPPTSSAQLSLFQRVRKYIRDNPYTKFSLTLCAIVLGLSIAVELGKKYKKKKPPNIVGTLPSVRHFTIQREIEVAEIDGKLKSLRKKGEFPVVYLTGSPGSGKSQLVSQYIKVFTASCYKWFGLKSVQPVVLYISGKNRVTFDLSLKETALSLGLNEAEFDSSYSTIFPNIFSRLKESKLPWLVVVDGLSGSLLSELTALIESMSHNSDGNSLAGGVVVTTTTRHVPQENHIAINEK